ncbi:serpin family protein [Nocardiopsis sp. CC223A]|uniref:serpin family protein n=1 Tax=Nocardiopsis sp. CC223A TaxID=3044051 RepID=UPI00278C01F1|nr:serpin family protein [Nocardiopsis sp. CC223A]
MTPELDPDHLRFALSLEDSLAEPDTSHVWSPHSAAAALSLLAAGASGEVLAALTRLLAADRGSLDGHVAALDAAVAADAGGTALGGVGGWAPPEAEEVPPLELASVNDLYVRADRTVLPGFAAALAERPASAVHRADFAAAPEKVREEINAAVTEVTRGMIPDLLPPGTVTADTESVLLNALWVRLVWTSPFDSAHTVEQVFHAPGGDRPVPTMRLTDHFQVAEAAGLRMLTLAGHHDLYLDVLLSEDGGTEPPVLTEGAHRELCGALRSQRVDVALPRFRVESGFELLPLLPELAATAGGPGDDLRGITGDPLQVDAIIHRAVLSVDEVGAEGAAATAVMAVAAAMPQRPVEFHVDRPFAFVLRRGSAALFLGRVTDPVDPGPAQPLKHPW